MVLAWDHTIRNLDNRRGHLAAPPSVLGWAGKLVLAVLVAASMRAPAQGTLLGDGTFINLDFESASIPAPQNGQFATPIPVAQAIPGWTAYLGTAPVSSVIANDSSLVSANVSILTPQWGAGPIFQGSFMVLLQAAPDPSGATATTAAIAQTGQIPLGAQKMLFQVATTGLQVTFAGAALPVSVYAKTASYKIFEANVSALAGQSGELRFTVLQIPGTGNASLDDIAFYGQAVPEPGTIVLLGLGGMILQCGRARAGFNRSQRRGGG